MRALLVVIPAVWLSGCAYVGEPLPPALNVPRAPTELTAEQVGSQLTARFRLPVETTEALPVDVKKLEVRAGAADSPEAAPPVEPVRRIDGGFAQADLQVPADWTGRPILVAARVASRQGKWSAWSNTVRLTVAAPLAPVAELRHEATGGGLKLRWKASGREAVEVRSERRWEAGGEAAQWEEAGVMNEAAGEWTDSPARFGESRRYRVEPRLSAAVRGAPVETAAITPEDRFAPAVPAGLQAVTGLGSIELTWDRPADADLAGFRVYRAEGGVGEWKALGGQAPAANFSDRTVEKGAVYRYAVTSVDLKGNESARSEAVTATAP